MAPTKPATVPFRRAMDEYLNHVEAALGETQAETYRSLREQEVSFLASRAVEYPEVGEQTADFLSLRMSVE